MANANDVNAALMRFSSAGNIDIEELAKGENNHQQGWLVRGVGTPRAGAATAKQVQGKQLSLNNLNDADAAYECVAEFDPGTPTVVIVKHANPCGVGQATSLLEAYRKAFASDPVSAFGGIVALNRPIDAETAGEITKAFTEVAIAPDASQLAREILSTKQDLRLLLTGSLPDPTAQGFVIKSVAGGLLVQTRDIEPEDAGWRCVTKRKPTAEELDDLDFAYTVAKHVKSNAIVYVKNRATVGIGAGQMSRVDSARIAANKAVRKGEYPHEDVNRAKGGVAASDAFFPFADGLIACAKAKVTAVIQPGGSKRDAEVIKAADDYNIAMMFTGTRHFRH